MALEFHRPVLYSNGMMELPAASGALYSPETGNLNSINKTRSGEKKKTTFSHEMHECL